MYDETPRGVGEHIRFSFSTSTVCYGLWYSPRIRINMYMCDMHSLAGSREYLYDVQYLLEYTDRKQ